MHQKTPNPPQLTVLRDLGPTGPPAPPPVVEGGGAGAGTSPPHPTMGGGPVRISTKMTCAMKTPAQVSFNFALSYTTFTDTGKFLTISVALTLGSFLLAGLSATLVMVVRFHLRERRAAAIVKHETNNLYQLYQFENGESIDESVVEVVDRNSLNGK